MGHVEFEKYKVGQRTKIILFGGGLFVAFILALANSQYAGEAFALLAGIVAGANLDTTE